MQRGAHPDTTETLEQARALDRTGRSIQVLILVKTTPTPSSKYEDTVCVAGWAVSPGPPRWVRLYPIPFRKLDAEHQLVKYSLITVKVSAPSNDARNESLRVDVSTIRVEKEHSSSDPERHVLVDSIPLTTACALRSGVETDLNGPSLGLVHPNDVALETKPHPGWNQRDREVIEMWQTRTELPLPGLERPKLPRLQAWYTYRCDTPGCKGHRQGILDWELTTLQRRARRDGANPATWIQNKFGDEMTKPGNRLRFILGNQAEGRKRRNFSVLSVYWPKETTVKDAFFGASTLF